MKATETPPVVSRSRIAGTNLKASAILTALTKTMKNKELVRLTKNRARNTLNITERSKER